MSSRGKGEGSGGSERNKPRRFALERFDPIEYRLRSRRGCGSGSSSSAGGGSSSAGGGGQEPPAPMLSGYEIGPFGEPASHLVGLRCSICEPRLINTYELQTLHSTPQGMRYRLRCFKCFGEVVLSEEEYSGYQQKPSNVFNEYGF